jgi:serine/threonine protein phosphatase 1
MQAQKISSDRQRFPAGVLGFAVGDIHGRGDLLARLLNKIEADAAKSPNLAPVVVFLGDYIDRGLESQQVIEMLLKGRPFGFERHFLRGNHEQAMQEFMSAPAANPAWLAYGGVETLLSYGVKPARADASDEMLKTTAEALMKAMPAAHFEFFKQLVPAVSIGDYFFVHAGVDPNRGETDQREEDLYWIRDRFLNDPRPWAKIVVHGHTPIKKAYRDHRRISIDTGAFATGMLTAARFQGNEVEFIVA